MSALSFTCRAIPGAMLLGFVGEEGLSSLFRFEIFVTIPEFEADALDLDAVIGEKAKLTVMSSEGAATSDYCGVIDEIETGLVANGQATLHVTMVPRLSALKNTLHSTIHTQRSARDVMSDVLQEGGLSSSDFAFRCTSSSASEEHISQYKESHYDFVARWMQREGLYYYFEHEDDADRLVIVDDKSAHTPCEPSRVRYFPHAEADHSSGPCLREFRAGRAAGSASVLMRDYDYAKPALDVSSREATDDEGDAEIVTHAARFFSVSDAQRLAKIRSGELVAESHLYRGQGTVFGLRPGYTFELEEHPDAPLNQSYLVTGVRHEGSNAPSNLLDIAAGRRIASGYGVSLTAIPANIQYRRKFDAHWPEVHGVEHGFVDGPTESDYAQLDDQGRYLVKMHFDEKDSGAGKSSTRIRMQQPHAGAPEGMHFPLRKGSEVLVAFHGGDPDRPYIAGFVPNDANPSPVTSANHTKNIIQTGGRTLIEIEDEKEKQHVFIYTPPKNTYLSLGKPFDRASHYITLHTEGDCLFNIGGQQDIEVGGKLTEHVKGNVSETYETSQTSTIDAGQTTNVQLPVIELYHSTQHTIVEGQRTETDNSGQLTAVLGDRIETYNSSMTSTVQGGVTEIYGGDLKRTVKGSTTETWDGPMFVSVGGDVLQEYPEVHETFGPTVKLWKSFDWTSGTIDITTPHMLVVTPDNSNYEPFRNKSQWFVRNVGNLSSTIYGVTISKYGVSVTRGTAQVTLNAIAYTYSVIDLTFATAAYISVTGLEIHLGKLLLQA